VLYAARCKYWTLNLRKKSPTVSHRTTLFSYIFATKAYINNRKTPLNNNISSTRPHNMVNFGKRTAEICWQVWGTPANFNGFHVLASLLHRRRSTEVNQTLHDVWPWLLPPYGILPGAKFTVRPSLAFCNIASVNARHSSSGRQPKFAQWYKEWNYGTFARRHFQQRAPPIFRGRPSRWALAHIL